MDKFINSKNSHGKSKLKYGTLFLTRSQEPEPNYIMAPVPAKSFGSVGPASVPQHWFSASFLKHFFISFTDIICTAIYSRFWYY